MKPSIEINEHVFKELEYMVELYQRSGAANPMQTVEDLARLCLRPTSRGGGPG